MPLCVSGQKISARSARRKVASGPNKHSVGTPGFYSVIWEQSVPSKHAVNAMNEVITIFALLFIFQLKHLFADYPLQGKYMLGKFKDNGWVFPLLAHVTVHGYFTLAICLFTAPHLSWLALFDMVAHFIMDRLKAGKRYLGRFKALSGKEYMELMCHLIDYQKASENDKKKYDIHDPAEMKKFMAEIRPALKSNTYFWWALGLDQMVHHLTHYAIIAALVLL